jgi:hypothetical protein
MNIHKSQLFWCELQGYQGFDPSPYWFTRGYISPLYAQLVKLKKTNPKSWLSSGAHEYLEKSLHSVLLTANEYSYINKGIVMIL